MSSSGIPLNSGDTDWGPKDLTSGSYTQVKDYTFVRDTLCIVSVHVGDNTGTDQLVNALKKVTIMVTNVFGAVNHTKARCIVDTFIDTESNLRVYYDTFPMFFASGEMVRIRIHSDHGSDTAIYGKVYIIDCHRVVISAVDELPGVDALKVNETNPSTSAEIVDEWENQSQASPTGFHVNVKEISSDGIAADNLESMFDGTGYNDPEAPAKQSQLSSLANVGAAINIAVTEDNTVDPIKGITFVGSPTLTYSATQAADDVYHKINDIGDEIDIVYGFDIGGDGIPTQLSMLGFLNGNNDALKVFGYDFVSTSWTQIGTLTGKTQEINDTLTFALFLNMVGTSGSDLGKVYIRFQNTGQVNSDLNIDHLFVSYSIVRRTVGYANGAIWIDTNNGTAGTENYVNGTADNPVLTLADALTIATSLSLSHFRIISSSTITLTTASESQLYGGDNWTIILNGQSISGTAIIGADVSGIGTGATRPRFTNCHFGDTTLPPSQLDYCGMSGTFTIGVAGTFCLDNCHSDVAGLQTPSLDFGSALNASSINLRDYSGGIHLKNMGAGTGAYTLSMEGDGQLIINANCSADSTIAIRGNFTITNNASGITISDDARFDVGQIDDTITNNANIVSIKAETDLLDGMIVEDSGGNLFTVAALQNTPMRGTDDAALASALSSHNTSLFNHAGVLTAHHTDLGELVSPIDETWERVMEFLDVAISTRATSAELITAMKAMTGITVGGTWTWEKVMKVLSAWIAGNWIVSPDDSSKQQLLDAEDGSTIILEQTLSKTTPYRTIEMKI